VARSESDEEEFRVSSCLLKSEEDSSAALKKVAVRGKFEFERRKGRQRSSQILLKQR